MNRPELAAFLRSRRHRLTPTDVGLSGGGRRRTPGLRRQEVAQLAGLSVDYYIRLEQGRGPHPSRQVLSALSRALMLTVDEREYLFRMAGESPPPSRGPSREVTPGTRALLDTLAGTTPAYVVDAKYDVLAWNSLATHFIGDIAARPESERNLIRQTFASDVGACDEGSATFVRGTVADLRAAYALYPGDPGIERLVTELLGTSPRFAEIWEAHDVQVRRRIVKQVEHPDLGMLVFECQVLHITATDQRLIVYSAEPGSPTQQRFQELAARTTTRAG